MNRVQSLTIIVAAVLVTAGCAQTQPAVLGQAPKSEPIVAIAQLHASPVLQTLQGRMIEKCPVAGCWFRIKDATGVVKVDTKDAGFVVVDVPLNTEMRVTGHMAAAGEPRFMAKGLSYQ